MFNNRVLILTLFLDYYYTDTDYYQCIRMSSAAKNKIDLWHQTITTDQPIAALELSYNKLL